LRYARSSASKSLSRWMYSSSLSLPSAPEPSARSSSRSSSRRHVAAHAVSRTPYSSTCASKSAAYAAVSSVSKSSLAAISAARSSLGKCCHATSLNLTQVARWSSIALESPPTPTTPLFIAVPPAGRRLLGGKQRRGESDGKKWRETTAGKGGGKRPMSLASRPWASD
jgi:hypothetical protein